ncbi:PilN domain-containing protein [Fluoribacter gormanii]|uniref:Fimbrial assembly protein (PilN) n=1 Tax=Fluoribacter gormanii TaxID=464 RepID=A0A377GH78_9GAMM|nr:PilN domain-containing protein [Fluoribacter gormanii]KTD03238.1 Tfp pilus assembly protein PilN [Fluoribacter gormanii]MCW8444289.1 PilN domain-containing protein [Fluoribacter gormanii]MCW8469482.1 PilN domain-containing protein [Fluoribacter gormanii]SIR71732.1 type IV pilus assembly protein PilN [Fluoribacter gormanii]STO24190.1 Fimbrial assembly protein (PilN) [Fluoribacter gormanii]
MTQINLLPWRELKREQDKKLFMTMLLVCIVFAAFVVFLINSYATGLVSNQVLRNQMLQKEINAMDAQIKEIKNLQKTREMLISRMSIVQHLQSTRTLMVHLFDELINVIPAGIYFTQIEGKNDVISVTGYAESNTFVSMLMRNIENNEWLHDPVLSEIKREDKDKDKDKNKQESAENEFKLTFVLAPQFQIGIKL